MTDQRFIAEGCSPMRMLAVLLALLAVNLVPALARQEEAPAATGAGRYRVQLRYTIDATGAQRYQRYQTFLKRLTAAGFQKEKGLEGEELHGSEMVGSLPANALPALLSDHYVRTALLLPEGATLPEDQPLLVRLYLTPDLGVARQKETADRVREQLKALGFQENTGADTQGQTRLLGRLPLASLKQLLTNKFEVPVLAKTEPGHPVFKTALVKAAVVLAEPEGFKPLPEPAATAEKPGKVSPALAKQAAEAGDKPVRVEVLLRQAPSARDTLANLQGTGFSVDGRLGANVYGSIPGKFVADLAALPEVSLVRLPEAARPFGAGGFLFVPLGREAQPAVDPAAWVRRQGPNKAVVIASDFTGWEQQKGKTLPAKTTLVDLTAELSDALDTAAAEGTGEGTKLAEQLVKQGGIEELILARIDSAAPWQVAAIAAAVNGRPWLTPALQTRMRELQAEHSRLEDQRKLLRVQRRIALSNFGVDESAKAAREKYRQAQKAFEQAEAAWQTKSQSLLAFQTFARSAKGANTVLLGLAWPEGYTDLPGGLPTLRGLNADDLAAASWLQAIPNRGSAVWQGVFKDDEGSQVLHFTPSADRSRADLNFLSWQPKDGQPTDILPAGLAVLLKLQWQEAHDSRLAAAGDDLFLQPQTTLRLVLLRQRDPSGKSVPADVFDVVARGAAVAERIENSQRDAIFETRLPFTISQPGRYAVMIEGFAGSARLPGPQGEVRPKLVVEATDASHRSGGRVLLGSHSAAE